MASSSLLLLGVIAVATVASGKIQMRNFPNHHCFCPLKVKEVCGTDGLTYRNFCFLDCSSRINKGLKMRHHGPCRSEYDLCSCPLVWRPICGSDGLTYGNMCELLCTAVHAPYDLHVSRLGTCPPISILQGSTIPSANPTEASPSATNTESSPTEVAASAIADGAMIDELGSKVDEEEPSEEESSPVSQCDGYTVCDKKRCKSEPVARVCGSNDRTYKNTCQFCCAYLKSPDLTIVSEGKCKAKKKFQRIKAAQKMGEQDSFEERFDEE